MTTTPGKPPEPDNKTPYDLVKAIPKGTIFAYNLDETKTPGEMKVRFKVRVVTGPAADRHEARLNEALTGALQWTRRHLMDQ